MLCGREAELAKTQDPAFKRAEAAGTAHQGRYGVRASLFAHRAAGLALCSWWPRSLLISRRLRGPPREPRAFNGAVDRPAAHIARGSAWAHLARERGRFQLVKDERIKIRRNRLRHCVSDQMLGSAADTAVGPDAFAA